MQLTDLNPPGGIGANCLLLQLDSLNIVVDAGLHPKMLGRKALPKFELLRSIPIDLIFLTHCHLDHLGALPVLARDHPNTPIIASRDTEAFYKRMLRNSYQVMDRQRIEHGVADYPLFSYSDITTCARQMIGLLPGQPRLFESLRGDRFNFTLYPSGHIPGAVGLLLEHRHRRIFHTGDVLFEDSMMLKGANFPGGEMDTVIVETTRGATQREASREDELKRLLHTIQTTTSHGGSILIPVFALGRMQELITFFHDSMRSGDLPDVPLFVSGLGIDLLNKFDQLSRKNKGLRCRRKMMRELGAEKMPRSHRPGNSGPAIYLLSSGMLVENTPSYMAAAALLDSHQNTICFVGYCDPDTPGGKLLKVRQGDKFVFKALKKTVPALAHIEKFDLSSHADREELLDYTLQRNPRAVVLTHGDPEARNWFRQQIESVRPDGECKIVDPEPLKPVTV